MMGSRLRLGWLRFWGWLANLAGFPAIVREGEYVSQLGVAVRIRTSALFTTITVNGVDVYFYRLTGGYDGVGFSQTSDCTVLGRAQSVGSGEQRAPLQSDTPRRRTQLPRSE